MGRAIQFDNFTSDPMRKNDTLASIAANDNIDIDDDILCNATRTGEIIIKGERHSGTNWITSIIDKNLRGGKRKNFIGTDSPRHGWKHGLYPPIGVGQPFSRDEVRVVVTRDAFVWLAKMKEDVYEPMFDPMRNQSFSDFIRSEYVSICFPENHKKCRKHNGGRTYHDTRRVYREGGKLNVRYDPVPKNVTPFERADNLVQARTMKYKQWLNIDEPDNRTYIGSRDEFVDNTLHVRFESIVPLYESSNGNSTSRELQNKFIGEPLRKRCIRIADEDTFEERVKYTKFNPKTDKKLKPKFDTFKERKKMLALYSKEDLRFVLSQLDLDFERSIGYNYDYVYDMIEKA